MLELLDSLVPLLLAISLATERLITIVKTVFPRLAEEQKTEAQEVDLIADRWRRVSVQGLAIVASWITVMLIVGTINPFAKVTIGGDTYWLGALALLGSGGSAFWNNVLGYTKALKDVKQIEKAATNLTFHAKASELGIQAFDGGQVARRQRAALHKEAQAALQRLAQSAQPAF